MADGKGGLAWSNGSRSHDQITTRRKRPKEVFESANERSGREGEKCEAVGSVQNTSDASDKNKIYGTSPQSRKSGRGLSGGQQRTAERAATWYDAAHSYGARPRGGARSIYSNRALAAIHLTPGRAP